MLRSTLFLAFERGKYVQVRLRKSKNLGKKSFGCVFTVSQKNGQFAYVTRRIYLKRLLSIFCSLLNAIRVKIAACSFRSETKTQHDMHFFLLCKFFKWRRGLKHDQKM